MTSNLRFRSDETLVIPNCEITLWQHSKNIIKAEINYTTTVVTITWLPHNKVRILSGGCICGLSLSV